jgi:hypothetical protein
MPLFHLVYVSSATRLFTPTELIELLELSRKKNQVAGITGMLLYRDGNFMQVLEGEEADVVKTHARITGDPRHNGLITLLKGEIAQRGFGDWSMGFRNLDSPDLRDLPGYSDFLNEDWKGKPMQESPHRALMLLHTFRTSQR